MSTEGIAAQIERVSLEIERQRDVLRKLESSKSLLQQQLNALRDPIARLPLEISSEIFMQCLPESDYPRGCVQPKVHLAPLLFLNISHAWTNIALANPSLWASIHIVLPRACTGSAELLEMWFRRARSRPLQIFLEGICDPLVASTILQRSPQFQSLTITLPSADDSQDQSDDEDELSEFFGGIDPKMELSSLKVLELNGRQDVQWYWLPFRQLLCRCPKLVELGLQDIVFIQDSDDEAALEPLVLPRLRILTYFEGFYALDWISAPRLKTLNLLAEAISKRSFNSFLRRSSPPLRRLWLHEALHFDPSFGESMALIPTLAQLECLSPSTLFAKQLFDFLVHNPHLLPNLRILKVDSIIRYPNEPSPLDVLDALAHVLSARRTMLKSVRLTIHDPYQNGPSHVGLPDDPLALFREYLDDGMGIYIGTET
ncbi:hypothetical protein FB45DRAFT_6083 [Roridomyces roridus]|uniref:F-box domain-containing protein n=1 Tax=Roridomyces roridus TaxID=1738132 RepID=A0AAD7CKM9_9AGAR|nr:hypothetical protein FB45DRAFT_6083 [Roridomyces roridus]